MEGHIGTNSSSVPRDANSGPNLKWSGTWCVLKALLLAHDSLSVLGNAKAGTAGGGAEEHGHIGNETPRAPYKAVLGVLLRGCFAYVTLSAPGREQTRRRTKTRRTKTRRTTRRIMRGWHPANWVQRMRRSLPRSPK